MLFRSAPTDRIIDGKDFSPLLLGHTDTGPRDTFFYYLGDKLDAVRHGKWKLHVRRTMWKKEEPHLNELYDVENDIGETIDVSAAHPEIVEKLRALIAGCRTDIGDAAQGIPGANRRPVGEVPVGVPLTQYDPECPYFMAIYDLDEVG